MHRTRKSHSYTISLLKTLFSFVKLHDMSGNYSGNHMLRWCLCDFAVNIDKAVKADKGPEGLSKGHAKKTKNYELL